MLDAVAQAHLLQQGLGALRSALHIGAAQHHRHHHVLQRGEFGQQMMELIDEAERAVAQLAARGIGELGHLLPGHIDLPRGGGIQAAQQMQQRALSRARRADNGHGLARLHRQVQPVEYRRLHLSFGVGLGQLLGAHDFARGASAAAFQCPGLIHSAMPPRGRYARRAMPDTGWRGNS